MSKTYEYYRLILILYSMIKIGVIDSGLGGLSIVRELYLLGAECDVDYIYDNKYHPYGNKCRDELTAITFNNVERLIGMGADIIVFACNTITSACVKEMRKTFTLPIIGTEPPLKPAIAECNKIAVLATPYTMNAPNTRRFVEQRPDKKFIFIDCDGLASAIEYSYANENYVTDFFAPNLLKLTQVDGVVLGCTHYYYIKKLIRSWAPYAKIYEPSSGVARRVYSMINKEGNMTVRISATGEKIDVDRLKKFIK